MKSLEMIFPLLESSAVELNKSNFLIYQFGEPTTAESFGGVTWQVTRRVSSGSPTAKDQERKKKAKN